MQASKVLLPISNIEPFYTNLLQVGELQLELKSVNFNNNNLIELWKIY